MSQHDAYRPRSVTKLHLPPCCSLCMPSLHSSAMPIPAPRPPPLPFHDPHHLSIFILLPHVKALLFPHSSYFPFIFPSNRLVLRLPLCQSLFHFPSSLILSFFYLSPFSRPSLFPGNLPSLSQTCDGRFCGSWAAGVNVKPFPAMIMFITHCVSRCPWINTN